MLYRDLICILVGFFHLCMKTCFLADFTNFSLILLSFIEGPTAMVQFRVWVVGDVGQQTLQDKLAMSLKHALCDVVMEYHLLTAPLCTIPKHMLELYAPPPTLSAPTSPFFSMQGNFVVPVTTCFCFFSVYYSNVFTFSVITLIFLLNFT